MQTEFPPRDLSRYEKAIDWKVTHLTKLKQADLESGGQTPLAGDALKEFEDTSRARLTRCGDDRLEDILAEYKVYLADRHPNYPGTPSRGGRS